MKRKNILSLLLAVLIFATSFQLQGMTAHAYSHYLSRTRHESSHIVTYQWGSGGKFHTDRGLNYIKENKVVLLHYMDGELGQCVYAEQETPIGAAKEFNPRTDWRTSWMFEKRAGYEKYKYIGLAQEYLCSKRVSLKGISRSSKLMALSKNDRAMLAQGFAWYMQHGSYNRTKGQTVKLIGYIKGFPAAKQIVLYDQIYTAAKAVMEDYTVTQKCYKLVYNGNSFQPIAVFKVVADPKPKKKKVEVSDSDSLTQKVNLNVVKTDTLSDAGLGGAKFKVTCNGKKITILTTDAEGKASYEHKRTLKTKKYSVTKTYITNWDDLDREARTTLTKNGYYQNKSKAIKAAKSEINKKIKAELQNLKAKTYDWKVTELEAPFGHKINKAEKSKTEKRDKKDLTFRFTDLPEDHSVTIKKVSETGEYELEATVKDATYGLFAAEPIYDTDNKTVLYKRNALVADLITDKYGKASISELKPGKYYLQERIAPEGFELSDKIYPIDLTKTDANQEVTDKLIKGKIRIHKTYGEEKLPEKSAEFAIYNSNNEKVDTLVIDENGEAVSKELPYGNYRVEQVTGVEGYAFLSTQNIKIDGSKAELTLSANDELEYAGIAISKTKHCDDPDTGSFWNEAEKGAEFEIIDAEDQVVEKLITDENGSAISQQLKPGTYTVHQTKGATNHEKVKDFKVTLKDGDNKFLYYDLVDESNASKICLKKVKVKDGKETAEANAEFFVLNAEYTKDIAKADLSTSQKRLDYVNSLPMTAVISKLTTDENGEACVLLKHLVEGKAFVVLQRKGANGYSLLEPYFSEKETPVMENGHPTYVIKGKDEFEDYAYVKVRKTMVTDRFEDQVVTEAEKDAEFEIMNIKGEVVETLTTDKNGEAVSGQLPYGTYFIHQSKGAATHKLVEDKKIILSKENKQATLTFDFENEEQPVEIKLTKRSTETNILLNDAYYEIYNERDEKVAYIKTGEEEDGVATVKLPYGKYYLKEKVSPDGYKCSKKKPFEVNFEAAPDGKLSLNDKDEPVYGKIAITKTGDILDGFTAENFQYTTGKVEGAVYGLYAKEAIKSDDGTILWKPGDLIDKKATNKKGVIQFTRKLKDGTETDGFPQGKYYIKELEAPYGYQLNEEEQEVVITWDTKPKDLNEVTKPVPEDKPEPAKPIEYPKANAGKYILKDGSKFHFDIEQPFDMETLTFTDEKAPAGAKTKDVSSLNDGSVVWWAKGNDYFVSTQKAGQDVILNAKSAFLLSNYKKLKAVYFDSVDSSGLIDATSMFMNCKALSELDLINFDTRSIKFVKKMFYGCSGLKKIYANTALIKDEPEQLIPAGVEVTPKYDFVLGTKYAADDFDYKIIYSNGSGKEINVTDSEVTIEPDTAAPLGKQDISFTFQSGECAPFGRTGTTVNVVDVPELDNKDPKDVEVNMDITDNLITHSIRISKEDGNGKPVAGATFGLYAAKNIIDSKGRLLFKANDLIATTKSELNGDGDAAVVSFSSLPSDVYADGTGELYYVKELQSAPGYEIAEMEGKKLSYDGSVKKYNGKVSGVIHDYEQSGIAGDVVYENEYGPVTNKKINKVVLQKIWDDQNNVGSRPEYITIKATRGSQVKEYKLTAANNWMAVTDIPIDEMPEWKFEEVVPGGNDKYNISKNTNPETGVFTVTNRPKKAYRNFVVEKVWDDSANQDGIRPESVKINLYRNGKYFNSTVLSENNNWKDKVKFQNLDVEDDDGIPYEYEFKEEQTDVINGDAKTGYEIAYSEEERIDSNGAGFTNVIFTNKHTLRNSKIVIHKKINGDVKWNLGEPEFKFLITGKTLDGEEVKLHKTIIFTKEEMQQLLAESKDGKVTKDLIFENLEPGTYTITEEDDDPYYEIEKIETSDVGADIDGAKSTYQLERKNGSYDGRTKDAEVTFYNKERTGKLKIKKKDEAGKPLEKVGFALYDRKHNLILKGTTDAKGELTFEQLPIGSYLLEETKTMSGKNKLTKPLKVTVPLTMTQEEVNEKDADTSKAIQIGETYYFYQLSYDITNSATLDMPTTGATPTYPWLFPAMLFMALGLFGLNKKKRKGCESDEKEC